jgi:hypothetical protein
MTPKEKAQELVNKYSIWCWNEVVCDYEIAKQCALIAVDEMIKHEKNNHFPFLKITDYLEQVKEEIGKL